MLQACSGLVSSADFGWSTRSLAPTPQAFELAVAGWRDVTAPALFTCHCCGHFDWLVYARLYVCACLLVCLFACLFVSLSLLRCLLDNLHQLTPRASWMTSTGANTAMYFYWVWSLGAARNGGETILALLPCAHVCLSLLTALLTSAIFLFRPSCRCSCLDRSSLANLTRNFVISFDNFVQGLTDC